MKFRLHFEINEIDDYIDVEGETIEEIKEIAYFEMDRRGVDVSQCWSEALC